VTTFPEPLRAALAERYRIERELGRGGMATVYLATDLKHHRQVAIKVLRPEIASALGPERFLREIELAAKLAHPNILALHDSGEVQGTFYYIMPYLPGESLRDRLEREKQLPLDDALRITGEIADALAYAHGEGVIHRDIKPENILFQAGHAVVADFGIAKAIASASAPAAARLTETGLSIGTPAYMSPEQAAGNTDLDQRSDLYSLGCVLYEMLCGEPPFSGANPQMILARKLTESVPSVRVLRETAPPSVDGALARALAKTPADRFGNTAEFVAALEAAAARRADSATGYRKALPWLAGTLVVIGITVLGVRYWPSTGEPARTSGSVSPAPVPAGPMLAVMPPTSATGDTALTRLGRELSLTMSSTLDGVGQHRTVDPLTILARVPEDAPVLGADSLLGIARGMGASRAIIGTLVQAGDQVRLDLSVTPVNDVPEARRLTLTGPMDDINTLTDSVSWAVLRLGWEGGFTAPPNLRDVSTHSLDALRDYLRGERLVVRGRWPEAEAAYQRAMERDTAFVLAAVGYARSRWWQYLGIPPEVTKRIHAGLDRLPEPEAFVWQVSQRAANPREGIALLADVTVRWPEWWPGWVYYGDRLFHVGPLLGHSMDEAATAFRRATELNTGLIPAYEHLVEATSSYQFEVARNALTTMDSLEPRDPISPIRHVWLGIQQHEEISDALVDSATALVRGLSGPMLPHAATLFGVRPGLQLEVNARIARDEPSRAAEFAQGDAALWAARGRWDSALAAASRYARWSGEPDGSLEEYRYSLLGAWLGALPDSLAERPRARLEVLLPDSSGPNPLEVFWLDGVRAWSRQDRIGLDSARGRLRQLEAEGRTGGRMDLAGRSLAAFALALEGDEARAGAQLAELEWEVAPRIGIAIWPAGWGLAIRRLAAARLVAAAGDTAQAVQLLRWFDAWGGLVVRPHFALGGPSLLERADLEVATDRSTEAARDYRLFLITFDQPVPALEPLQAHAEHQLAALQGRRGPSRTQLALAGLATLLAAAALARFASRKA
jgi:tRNA A-37 threonylcarbamoyl transferase component Bud32